MSNDFLKTRLLGLELEALGYKSLSPLESWSLFALRDEGPRRFHYSGTRRRGHRTGRRELLRVAGAAARRFPRRFRGRANAPAPKPIDNAGGAAAQLDDIDLAAARGGHSRQEFFAAAGCAHVVAGRSSRRRAEGLA